ncbi:AraC family transcriptional regulator [Paenibacillus daejeonensis]|uniref:AraC family transcriptional regulator n=1 Tax=Paenibacillus daejeonensis TaxID=135193 RepID=UPI000365F115|nr:AraC family transcriptional regulator [Paenibacillus daejeonensis]
MRQQPVPPMTMPHSPSLTDGAPIAVPRRSLVYKGTRSSVPRQRRIGTCALLYIKRGSGELVIDDARVQLSDNLLLLLTPGMHVTEKCESHSDWEVYYLAFQAMQPVRSHGNWRMEPVQSLTKPMCHHRSLTDTPDIQRLLGELTGGESGIWPHRWRQQLALTELLYHLLLDDPAGASPSISDSIARSVTYIDRQYADPIRIERLADSCGLHPSTFSRHFKQIVGMSPSDYLTHVRIEAAKGMLSSARPLREVAHSTGYCDEYYFSRMFKKSTGVSPSLYLRTNRPPSSTIKGRGLVLEPRNIAVTYVDEADHMIALGLLPAAVPSDHGFDGGTDRISYLQRYVRNLPSIGCEESIDKMLLRKLRPELIIACRYMEHWGVTGLEEIAPTHYYAWEVDWRSVHRELGQLLEREAQAEHNIIAFDRLVRTARARLFPACSNKSFVFLETTRGGIRVSPFASNGGWLLYHQLGLSPAPAVSYNNWEHFVSSEEAALLQADYLFVGRRSGSQATYTSLMTHPGIRQRRGRVFDVPRYPWGKGGPLAFSRGIHYLLSLYEKLHK